MPSNRSTALLLGPLATLAFAASPVSAQSATGSASEASAHELSDTLRDPQVKATVAATVAILGEVMLDLPVGPLVEAMDEAVARVAEETGTAVPADRAVDPDATLRDVLGPDGDRLTTRLAERVPQAMDTAAGLSEAAEAMVPRLRDAAERLKRTLPARMPVLSRD
jgi:hypothetical protein